MTIAAFLKQLRVTPGPWAVLEDGAIRRDARNPVSGICPICAVAKRSRLAWWDVYRGLRLSHRDAGSIAIAADKGDGYDPALRRKLLAATVKRA